MEARVIVCDFQDGINREDIQETINDKIRVIEDAGLQIVDIKINVTTEAYIMTLICVPEPKVMPISGPIMGPPILTS